MELRKFFDNFELLADAPNGVQKLRELILQLAVQGKLVPQNSDDKSPSAIVEKQKKIRAKDFKVKDFLVVQNGYAFKSQWFVKEGIRLLRNANIGHGTVKWSDVAKLSLDRAKEFDKFKLRLGDIVISLDRPIISTGLKVARITERDLPSLLLQRVGRVEFKTNDIDPDYFFLWLNSPYFIDAIDPGRSNGVPHISSKSIESLSFTPPSLAEQHRIVAKVDALMKLCDELETRQQKKRDRILQLGQVATTKLITPSTQESFNQHWKTISDNFDLLYSTPENVKQLRQTILQLAVMGKLVPQNPDDEPASVLLEKIKKEKERLIKEGKIKKSKELPSVDVGEMAFDLPQGWEWVRLENLCEIITKGSSPKWQGVNYVKEEEGILFITSENVKNYLLNLENSKYVENKFNEIEPRSILKRDDILMNIVGASIGRTALYDLDEVANINQAVCLIRILNQSRLLNLQYLLYFFNSSVCISFMFDKQVDNARANLSMGNISKFPIPLPPLAEQHRIVTKVDAMMKLCDELEAKLTQSISDRDKLMSAAVRQVLTA